MDYPNVFDEEVTSKLLARLEQLTPETKPNWGKMNAPQMLAHLNVAYFTTYSDKAKRPNAFARFLIKTFVKSIVVGSKPYKKNSPTATVFKIVDEREFEKEKQLLIKNINKTQKLGEDHFDGKENISFGKLSKNEWNTLFFKHMDHHFNQFGI